MSLMWSLVSTNCLQEWYLARLVGKNEHQKYTCYNKDLELYNKVSHKEDFQMSHKKTFKNTFEEFAAKWTKGIPSSCFKLMAFL